jgi:hypothetical protein
MDFSSHRFKSVVSVVWQLILFSVIQLADYEQVFRLAHHQVLLCYKVLVTSTPYNPIQCAIAMASRVMAGPNLGRGCTTTSNRRVHTVRVQAAAGITDPPKHLDIHIQLVRRQLLAGMALFAGCPCCMQATAAAEGLEEPAFSYGAKKRRIMTRQERKSNPSKRERRLLNSERLVHRVPSTAHRRFCHVCSKYLTLPGCPTHLCLHEKCC